MTLEKLNYLIVLSEEKNITKAARRLYISQPSLTGYLNRLEADLGFHIFDRNHTPIQLTPNGQLYIDKMRLILSEEENLKEELRLREKMIETVSIGIGHLHSNIICPSLIKFLSEKCPHLNISILEGGEVDLMKKMKHGQIDLFLGFTVIDNSDYIYGKLWNESIAILVPNKFLKLSEETLRNNSKNNPYILDSSVLDNIPVIMPSSAQGLNHNYQQLITRTGLHPARIYRTGNMLTGIQMVGKEIGYLYNSPNVVDFLESTERENIVICSDSGSLDMRDYLYSYSENNAHKDNILEIISALQELKNTFNIG